MSNFSGNRRLIAAVALASTVIDSGIAFVEGVVQRLRDGASDPDFDPDALADELESDANRLAAAIAANTPATQQGEAEQVDPALAAEVEQIVATDGQDAGSTSNRMTGESGSGTVSGESETQVGGESSGGTVETGSDLGGAAQSSSGGGNVGSEPQGSDTQNSDGPTTLNEV